MQTISYAQAIVDALHSSMAEDPRVTLIGSYVLGVGPKRVLMDQIRADFPERIIDPPTSEAAVISIGIGAAMAGARPFVDIGTASFVYVGWSPLVNEAPLIHYMTGGQIRVPMVVHMLHGIRGGGAAQHSGSPQAMLWNVPGLEIVTASTPHDIKGLLRTAIRSDNPTVVLDHAKLLAVEGPVPRTDYEIPFGLADIKRAGRDVTLVASSWMVHVGLAAAERLASEGIEVEIVDPRTLVPLDHATLLASVARTGRLVVLDETHLSCGVASEIAAIVAEEGFDGLRAPIVRVARPDVPMPFSPPLEAALTPSVEHVVAAVHTVMRHDSHARPSHVRRSGLGDR